MAKGNCFALAKLAKVIFALGGSQADDVSVMRAAYELKADRVRDINTDLKMMKVAYTRRWVAATTKSLPAKQSASDWTWASTSTSSEMSASSSLQAGIAATIASQVRGRLAGRTVSRDDVAFRVLQELSDVFRMAMVPERVDFGRSETGHPRGSTLAHVHTTGRCCSVCIYAKSINSRARGVTLHSTMSLRVTGLQWFNAELPIAQSHSRPRGRTVQSCLRPLRGGAITTHRLYS